MNDTIDFTPEAVKQYLVAAVQQWRQMREKAPGPDSKELLMAVCYIDAFQSVHTTLFGTVVPKDTNE